jgi:uncharacterized membrane protein
MNARAPFLDFTAFFIVSVLTMTLVFSGCKHDPTLPDVSGPGGDTTGISTGTPCNPDSVYFELQVLPILRSNCAMSGCHDEASRRDGVILTSYQRVMQTAGIRAYDLSDSELYEVITETRINKRMPPSPMQALSAEQISIIARWINQGAQNRRCDPDAGPCQTDNRSWTQHIRPIIQTNCAGCHSGANPGGGLNFSTHAGVVASIANGRLIGAINHQVGYKAMPQGGAKLPDCSIQQMLSWVNAGAPNN